MTSNYRIDHPRRRMPTLRVFHEFVLILEQDLYRDDVPAVVRSLDERLSELEFVANPRNRAREIVLEALR